MTTYKISELTSASPVSATDLFEVSQVSASNYGTRKASASQLRTYALAAMSGYTLARVSLANVSATTTLDLNSANFFSAEVGGSTTFVFANAPVSTVAAGLILEITNGGNYTVVWPSSVKWPDGLSPFLTADGTDVFVFITDDGGVAWRGAQAIRNSM